MVSTITDRLAAAVDGVAVQGKGMGIVVLTQTGGTNAVQCSSFPVLTDWVLNQIFAWRPTAANTGVVTLSIDGIGSDRAVLKPNGSGLDAGDIQVGLDLMLRYDGSDLRIMGSGF